MTPREAQAALAQGNRLLAGGQLPEAIRAFETALSHDRNFGAAWYNLGVALRRAGDPRGAALAFRVAARLDPSDFEAMQNVVSTLGAAVAAGTQPFPCANRAAASEAREAFTIVTCSIDPARLARMRASLEPALAGRPHEFVVIADATSLAEGYMRALERCRHEHVLFTHDDVELVSHDAFATLAHALRECDIVGLAGARRVTGPAVMWAGHPHLHGRVAYPRDGGLEATVYSLECGLLQGMASLDGFFLATRREVARRVGFDAATFDGFHFYDLDFAWRARGMGLRLAVTTAIAAIHASEGDFGADWQRYAQRFTAKYPELDAASGAHHAYNVQVRSHQQLLAFHEALHGLAEAA